MFDGPAAHRGDQPFQIEAVVPTERAVGPTDDAHTHCDFSRRVLLINSCSGKAYRIQAQAMAWQDAGLAARRDPGRHGDPMATLSATRILPAMWMLAVLPSAAEPGTASG
jgi:hypothetical protein